MNKIRVIQKFMKGEKVFWPGEFIEDELDKEEIQEKIKTGFLTIKVVVKKKPAKKKKAKDVKNA